MVLFTPKGLIDDRPIRFGSYAPENFDVTFQGTVCRCARRCNFR